MAEGGGRTERTGDRPGDGGGGHWGLCLGHAECDFATLIVDGHRPRRLLIKPRVVAYTKTLLRESEPYAMFSLPPLGLDRPDELESGENVGLLQPFVMVFDLKS